MQEISHVEMIILESWLDFGRDETKEFRVMQEVCQRPEAKAVCIGVDTVAIDISFELTYRMLGFILINRAKDG